MVSLWVFNPYVFIVIERMGMNESGGCWCMYLYLYQLYVYMYGTGSRKSISPLPSFSICI